MKTKAERDYDRTANEGGEGFNPHRAARQDREAAEAAAQPVTRADRRYTILRLLERLDCSAARESGTFDAARVEALQAELATMDAEDKAAFAAEWTAETTEARRNAWNARVKAGEFTTRGQVNWVKLRAAEAAQGWTHEDLKRAIESHKAVAGA